MRIGQLVRRHLPLILSYCEETDRDEFDRLTDLHYSRETFGIHFPFLAEIDSIAPGQSQRYWSPVHIVQGRSVRATNHWFERSLPLVVSYLVAKGLASERAIQELVGSEPTRATPPKRSSSRANSRYRGWAIGNAQNLVVRNVLSRLGLESFQQRDWQETIEHFDNRCAYCGQESEQLLVEHAIPINRTSLGEHRLGNLVPSCKPCNSKKADRDFRDFLEGDNEAASRIEAYMESRGYEPLGDNPSVRRVLEMAHKEVAKVADRYVTILNEVILDGPSQAADDGG